MIWFEALDLPLIWAGVLAAAVFMYVLLDGFDLGIGILFPLARDDMERTQMMNSVAPVWDGNETWLVLGGGGLFAAFPKAYAALLPAVYMPIGFMLTALIFRGVAFEFRGRAGDTDRRFWDQAFHWGSAVAAFSQGLVLGAFVQGTVLVDGRFAGGAFDWLTPFAFLTGLGVMFGYGLLGATWLVIKTEDDLQVWARHISAMLAPVVLGFMTLVSLWVALSDPVIAVRWGLDLANVDWVKLGTLSPLPLAAVLCAILLFWLVRAGSTYLPFWLAVVIFGAGYAGLGYSLYPNIVPPGLTFRDAAAAPNSQALLLAGVVVMLPVILIYTGYVYRLFRGKVADEGYH